MEISDFFNLFFGYFIIAIPALIFWVVVLVLIRIRLQNSRARAKRFLIIGAILGLSGSLIRIPLLSLAPLFFHKGNDLADINTIAYALEIIPDIINMAGIICLFYAFWLKFKAENTSLRKAHD